MDSERGNDSQDGTKPETAWCSLTRVNRATLVPGDRVLFRRGQSWRGQLIPRSGNAEGVIYYGAFGDGPKPILMGSVAKDRAEDWLPVGNGIWETTPLRFEATGIHADLPLKQWSLHQEGGAACTFTPEENAGVATLRLACRNSGTQAHHLQLMVPGFKVREGEFYLLKIQVRSTRPFKPQSITLMKSGAPWTTYADTETTLPAIGTHWTEHTIRFHALQSADDARLTLFLGGTLPPDTELYLQTGALLKANSNQAIPLAVDVGNVIFDYGKATGIKKWSAASLHQDGDYFYDANTWQVLISP